MPIEPEAERTALMSISGSMGGPSADESAIRSIAARAAKRESRALGVMTADGGKERERRSQVRLRMQFHERGCPRRTCFDEGDEELVFVRNERQARFQDAARKQRREAGMICSRAWVTGVRTRSMKRTRGEGHGSERLTLSSSRLGEQPERRVVREAAETYPIPL